MPAMPASEPDRPARPIAAGRGIHDRIRAARLYAGLSQKKLARAVGVSEKTVGLWESGEDVPRLGNTQKIAEATGVTLEEIVGVLEGQDPSFKAYAEIKERPEWARASDAAKMQCRRYPWAPGYEPTLGDYLQLLSFASGKEPPSSS